MNGTEVLTAMVPAAAGALTGALVEIGASILRTKDSLQRWKLMFQPLGAAGLLIAGLASGSSIVPALVEGVNATTSIVADNRPDFASVADKKLNTDHVMRQRVWGHIAGIALTLGLTNISEPGNQFMAGFSAGRAISRYGLHKLLGEGRGW